MRMLSQAIGRTLLGEGSRAVKNQEKFQRLLNQSLFYSIIIGAPIVLAISVLAAWAFSTILPIQWREAAILVLLMAPRAFGNLIESPSTTIFLVLKRQAALTKWSIARMLVAAIIIPSFFFLGVSFLSTMFILSMTLLVLSIIRIQNRQKNF